MTTSEGTKVHRFDPDNSKRNVLFAQPHPYLDVSRLQPRYERDPTWLFYAKEFLSSRALAVILTYPPDVQKLKTHLLRPLEFREPYHVLAVSERVGAQASHAEVLLLARRGEGLIDLDLRFLPGELRLPVPVAKQIAPEAKSALLMFKRKGRVELESELMDARINFFRADDWAPWEE
ncbi:hypothetical protein XH89_00905 [Bradyrhizobium sp. CCBAU 53340]|uniref:hypothetical protein n=1 Tax=Bradyrhizobium sp. CCBAU 53340 TaxID=1325112 RepID=UPI00188B6D8E|nr:hypothetical protein [Bradyrhizobium sp. CCBAU 53340]QOZ42184.1 hypothetical protein XH89_00905 [Bradyrhizobium sp. CCBAU 53340]